MPSEATTLRLPQTPSERARAAARRAGGLLSSGRAGDGVGTGARAEAWIASVALVAIVALSLLLVVIVADRPSGLSPTTHANFFPGWMR